MFVVPASPECPQTISAAIFLLLDSAVAGGAYCENTPAICPPLGPVMASCAIFPASTKSDSVESGKKISNTLGQDSSAHPSLSCNAIIYSNYEASKEEVTQTGKASATDDLTLLGSGYVPENGMGTFIFSFLSSSLHKHFKLSLTVSRSFYMDILLTCLLWRGMHKILALVDVIGKVRIYDYLT